MCDRQTWTSCWDCCGFSLIIRSFASHSARVLTRVQFEGPETEWLRKICTRSRLAPNQNCKVWVLNRNGSVKIQTGAEFPPSHYYRSEFQPRPERWWSRALIESQCDSRRVSERQNLIQLSVRFFVQPSFLLHDAIFVCWLWLRKASSVTSCSKLTWCKSSGQLAALHWTDGGRRRAGVIDSCQSLDHLRHYETRTHIARK